MKAVSTYLCTCKPNTKTYRYIFIYVKGESTFFCD